MPIITGAKKKLRSDARKEIVNKRVREKIKASLRAFKTNPSQDSLRIAYSALDLAAKKNVIPKNKASRKKSRLAVSLAKNSQAPPKNLKTNRTKKSNRKISSAKS